MGIEFAFLDKKSGYFYIGTEFHEGGDFFDYLEREKALPEDKILKFAANLCEAVHFLHYKDIIHRDIKPENLLMDING